MSQGYVAFDIETSGLLGDDKSSPHPPAVFCACATVLRRAAGPGAYEVTGCLRWHSASALSGDRGEMNVAEIRGMVTDLLRYQDTEGYQVVTWNGVGFDFRVLHEHALVAGDAALCARIVELTGGGCDMMLNFFMHKGFPVSLNSVAVAVNPSFVKSGAGGDVCDRWNNGDAAEREAVIRYCERDTEVLAAAVSAADATGSISWKTKRKGNIATWAPVGGRETVFMASRDTWQLPEPDNSWMGVGDRPSIRKFAGWLDI